MLTSLRSMQFLVLVAIFMPILILSCNHPPNKDDIIHKSSLENHIQTLASNEFMGRMPFTVGEEKTVAYLTEKLDGFGLEPGNSGSFVQEVPLVEITTTASDKLTITDGQTEIDFDGLKDYVFWTRRTEPAIDFDKVDVVFAGFGIVAPEYGWDDYKDIDVKGKIVVVLVNDPGFGTEDENFFKGNTMTYYGRWTYKFEEATRQGALGCLVIHNTIPAGYGFNVLQNSWNSSKLYLDQRGTDRYEMAFEGWITLPTANKLFQKAGINERELLSKARRADFKAIPLDIQASGSMVVSSNYDVSQNVISKISGTKRAAEYIIYTAHWDHLGIGTPDETGDSIYNGALDNASGTAALLEIARAFKDAPQAPERTVIFLFVTAEEQGLWGSAYYAENPIYPIANTVANINMDGINPYGMMKDLVLVGMGQSELEDLAAEELGKVGRYVAPEPNPSAGYYFRSDHFNFAKVGIPALYTNTGIDNWDLGKEHGKKLQENYVSQYYHKPSDAYDTTRWNLDGAVADVTILFKIGQELANSTEWPGWKDGSEFKAIRTENK